MNILAIDLGTTNIKVAAYDKSLKPLVILSDNVTYQRKNDFVEFDVEHYFSCIKKMIERAASQAKLENGENVAQIVLTGQAESLILLDEHNKVIHPGISWLDMRSRKECDELAAVFEGNECFYITGQPEIIPTWPVTKILWFKKNKSDIFNKTAHYLLLKDYIIFRLCGKMLGDYSIYSFSHYFNITEKCYWQEILDYCGVRLEQLPEVVAPCSIAGNLLDFYTKNEFGLTVDTKINVGTLDHFAGMIGTGNISEGVISESAGTVLSLATLLYEPMFSESKLPLNCGPFPGSYVLLPVCESGGFSLEWYKQNFLPQRSFAEISHDAAETTTTPPVFLPYLTGVNAPDFNDHASGVFFGVHASHSSDDFTLAIMQGVACLLRKNIDYMEAAGVEVKKIISTGGGARSPFWTQIKSDITRKSLQIPENEEAACFGAAIIGAVDEGYVASFAEAAEKIKIVREHTPEANAKTEAIYTVFTALYDALQDVYALNARLRG